MVRSKAPLVVMLRVGVPLLVLCLAIVECSFATVWVVSMNLVYHDLS
jgi:hypothetical protein